MPGYIASPKLCTMSVPIATLLCSLFTISWPTDTENILSENNGSDVLSLVIPACVL